MRHNRQLVISVTRYVVVLAGVASSLATLLHPLTLEEQGHTRVISLFRSDFATARVGMEEPLVFHDAD